MLRAVHKFNFSVGKILQIFEKHAGVTHTLYKF